MFLSVNVGDTSYLAIYAFYGLPRTMTSARWSS